MPVMTKAPDIPSTLLAGGVAMPMVGFGTWRLRGSAGYEAILAALRAGYRHIDTATMYGNEAEVGHALRDSGLDRRQVFLTTKLPPGKAGRERQTLCASLRALGTDYVDLWLVHWPPAPRALTQMWREFLTLRGAGHDAGGGGEQLLAGPDRHADPASAVRHRPSTRSRGARPVTTRPCWRPAGSGTWSSRGTARSRAPTWPTRCWPAIADRHGVTPAQVVLRWHLEHGIPVIPKSAQPAGSRPTSTCSASRSARTRWPASTACPAAEPGQAPARARSRPVSRRDRGAACTWTSSPTRIRAKSRALTSPHQVCWPSSTA